MSNVFDDMRAAVRDAANTLRAADNVAGDLAWLLRGRLRKVQSVDSLRALKRELSHFNIKTGEWSDKP